MRDIDEQSGVPVDPYDVCIIGAGPAGIVLCSELASANLRICVLESGGLQKSQRGDELRRVISEGIPIKDYSRERVVGGASTTWSGLSAPLDPVDMSERAFLKVPGWPISRQELEPYWKAVAERYRFPKGEVFEEFTSLREKGDLKPMWTNFVEKVFIAPSLPQRFAKEHQAVLARQNVELLYNATVIRLEGPKDKNDYMRVVDRAVVISNTKKRHEICARVFVLAAGGIENARLLLASNGLGNERDQVGRYFMNHPKNNYGIIKLNKPVYDTPYFFGCLKNYYAGFAGMRLRESYQKEQSILNSYVRLAPIYPWSNNNGVEAAIFLFKKMQSLFNFWKKTKSRETLTLRDYAETDDDSSIQNNQKTLKDWLKIGIAIAINIPAIISYTRARLFVKRAPAVKKISIRNFMEMEPHPANRVVLSDKTDVYGQFIPLTRLKASVLDRRSLVELHRVLALEVRENNLGVLEGALWNEDGWPINQDASHHLGTTRMGKDPATSVVNENLRLHSIENVYCAGGSVFSTSGCANPTFTLCALSIRLAEYLKKQLAKNI